MTPSPVTNSTLPTVNRPNWFTRVSTRLLVFGLGDLLALASAAWVTSLIAPQSKGLASLSYLGMSFPLPFVIYASLVLIWIVWFGLVERTYTRRQATWLQLRGVFQGLLFFGVSHSFLLEIIHGNSAFSTAFCLLVTQCFFITGARHISRKIASALNCWLTPTLIFGTGDNARQAYRALMSDPGMGYDVKAFLQPANDIRNTENLTSPVPGIACLRWPLVNPDFGGLAAFHNVIAMDIRDQHQRDALIRQLTVHEVQNVHVIPSMRGVPLHGMQVSNFFSHEVLLIQLRNNSAKLLHRIYKRGFDVVGSLILLTCLSPLFALLAYKISRDGGRPIFSHPRVGRKGKQFNCYKFRSMVSDAPKILQQLLASDPAAQAEWARDFKLKNDPRVTKLGALLRRSSLDELPQLWNVLIGDMSLVGPRPVVTAELERYGTGVDYYLMTKPGMTGLWQVSGRNDIDYAERVYLDAWYMLNWSLWTDISILFKTISVVRNRSGAY